MGGSSCHYSSSDNDIGSCSTYAFSNVQLSAGAITGIVIGSLVATLIIIIIVIWAIRAMLRRPPVRPVVQQPYIIGPPQGYPQIHQTYAPPQPPSYSQATGNYN
jgi:hypothetical protein